MSTCTFFLPGTFFQPPLPPDEDEFIDVLPTGFTEAQEMVSNGTIIDAKTALGIILAAPYINGKNSNEE